MEGDAGGHEVINSLPETTPVMLTCFNSRQPKNCEFVLLRDAAAAETEHSPGLERLRRADATMTALKTTSRSLGGSTLAVKPAVRLKTSNSLSFMWRVPTKERPKCRVAAAERSSDDAGLLRDKRQTAAAGHQRTHPCWKSARRQRTALRSSECSSSLNADRNWR